MFKPISPIILLLIIGSKKKTEHTHTHRKVGKNIVITTFFSGEIQPQLNFSTIENQLLNQMLEHFIVIEDTLCTFCRGSQATWGQQVISGSLIFSQCFAVRSLGWVEMAEEDLAPGKSSVAVNNCIRQLSYCKNDIRDTVGIWGEVSYR